MAAALFGLVNRSSARATMPSARRAVQRDVRQRPRRSRRIWNAPRRGARRVFSGDLLLHDAEALIFTPPLLRCLRGGGWLQRGAYRGRGHRAGRRRPARAAVRRAAFPRVDRDRFAAVRWVWASAVPSRSAKLLSHMRSGRGRVLRPCQFTTTISSRNFSPGDMDKEQSIVTAR